MDLATILGLVIGTALVLASMFIEASAGGISMLKFWSTSSMMIVLGGTVAATAVAFRLNEVLRVLAIIKFAFSKPKFKSEELVQTLIDLAEVNRKGPAELEKELPNIKNPFIQDGVAFVTQGMKLDDMREILEQREAFRYKRELHESELMKTMGTYAPAFGMVGTLIGLVIMLGNLQDQSAIGPAMAIALLTTFYGSLIANIAGNPIKSKLAFRSKQEATKMSIIIAGTLGIVAGENPRLIKEKLSSFLPPAQREVEDAGE